jgi:hypothetical protein
LTEEQVTMSERDGFIKLKQVFPPEMLNFFDNEIRQYLKNAAAKQSL